MRMLYLRALPPPAPPPLCKALPPQSRHTPSPLLLIPHPRAPPSSTILHHPHFLATLSYTNTNNELRRLCLSEKAAFSACRNNPNRTPADGGGFFTQEYPSRVCARAASRGLESDTPQRESVHESLDHGGPARAMAVHFFNPRLIRDLGTFISALFLLLILSFAPHRALCGAAVAAGKTSRRSTEHVQTRKNVRKEELAAGQELEKKNSPQNEGFEFGTEDEDASLMESKGEVDASVVKGVLDRIEGERGERVRKFEDALGTKRRVEQLEGLRLEGVRPDAALEQKIEEEKQAVIAEGMRLQGEILLEMEAALTSLSKEETKLANQTDKAVKEYQNLKAALQKLDATKQNQIQKWDLESKLRGLRKSINDLSENLKRVKTEIFSKRVEGWKAAAEDLVSALEHSLAAFAEFQQQQKESSGGRTTKNSSTLSYEVSILKGLGEAGQKMWEQKLLPLALEVYDATEPLDDEVNMPGVEPLSLALSWKKWRADKRDELKQYLLDNPQIGKQYVAEKQEEILKARDRVLAQTWYNEMSERWEISPLGASYATTKLLVESAHIRQDRRLMYLRLKGEERDYFLDVKAYDENFDKYGGFDGLYLKMVASGILVTEEKMQIPFYEWEIGQQLQLPFKGIWWLLQKIWYSDFLIAIKPLYMRICTEAFEDLMVRFVLPLANHVLPQKAKVFLKLELPEGAEQAELTSLMVWKEEAKKRVDLRAEKGNGPFPWWMAFTLRCYIVGAPIVFALPWVAKVIFYPFQARSLEPNEVEWKRKKVEKLQKRLEPGMKRQKVDPVKTLFDRMKRVKQPQVSLKDFAGIETVKEEVTEVITFLKNPNAFKEIGARPPRGVLIVGESGTGKTTLAMAIAAEAKVPLVEVQGTELEGGAWVGQGASNVRELFKTARELAPLIIFMDDFDHFAGIRGTTSDTSSQEHESLINQLLVELDGFETQEGVVLIATTSKPWTIDEALRRPGRMDRTILLPSPNRREREQILQKVAEETMDKKLINYVNWALVAEKTAGLAPSQLKYVPQALESNALRGKVTDEEELFCIYGWLVTINSVTPKWIQRLSWVQSWEKSLVHWLGLEITKEDMESAVDTMDAYGQTKTGLEIRDPPYVTSRQGKFPHAVWAAGRGLVALLLPNFDVVDHIWLDPTSWEGIGFTSLTQKLDEGYQETGTLTRSYYEKQLVLCFGSYVASQMLLPYGENNNLSRFEIEEAKEISANMVLRYGWGPDDSPLIYSVEGSEGAMSMGEEYEWEVAEKVKKLYLAGYQKALKMLQQNRPVLEILVERLLDCDVLSYKDMNKLLLDNGAIFEKEPFSLFTYSRAEEVSQSGNGTGRLGVALSAAV